MFIQNTLLHPLTPPLPDSKQMCNHEPSTTKKTSTPSRSCRRGASRQRVAEGVDSQAEERDDERPLGSEYLRGSVPASDANP